MENRWKIPEEFPALVSALVRLRVRLADGPLIEHTFQSRLGRQKMIETNNNNNQSLSCSINRYIDRVIPIRLLGFNSQQI